MHYTLFELERIEKILNIKLDEAREAYMQRLDIVQNNFRAMIIESNGRQERIVIHGSAAGYEGEPVSGELSAKWKDFQLDDMDLVFLHGEVDLFKSGINSLYSYWNYAVEIFIDNMRTRITEKEKT